MKRLILAVSAGLAMTVLSALAQTGTNDPIKHAWTNDYDHDYLWGTNNLCLSNCVPNLWSNKFSHSYAGAAAGGTAGEIQNRFGRALTPDAALLVRNFERDRERLMLKLKTCSDEQRQALLQEMEQLRIQLRERICDLREQALQQAEQMRTRFGNSRDELLNQGAAGPGAGRDR